MNTHGLSLARRCDGLLQFAARRVARQIPPVQSAVGRCLSPEPVHGIPHDGMSDRRAVHIQLVSSSRDAGEEKSRNVVSVDVLSRDDLVFRKTVLGALEHFLSDLADVQIDEGTLVIVGTDPHEGGVLVIPHEGEVDASRIGRDVPAHESLVVAGDLTGAEEGVHSAKGGVGASEDDEAGGVHSQSVDDHFVHAAGFGSVLVEDGLVQGRVALVLARDGEDAGRLADHDYVFVFVDDVKVICRNSTGGSILGLQFLERSILLGLDIGRSNGVQSNAAAARNGVILNGSKRRNRRCCDGKC
mmetsp:Transcript_5807/g.10479  ORF Transcript_5807/g.10479 Transcript_5807/m.10479 type:complete len:300 (-) Transcript_5807:128-1027(-)